MDTIRPAYPSETNDFSSWLRNLLTPAGAKEDIFSGLAGGIQELGNPELARRRRFDEQSVSAQPEAIQPPPITPDSVTPMGTGRISLEDVAGPGISSFSRPSEPQGPAMGAAGPQPGEDAKFADPVLAENIMETLPNSGRSFGETNPSHPATVSGEGESKGKSNLLKNILKAMGLVAGGVAIHKLGGEGALEGSIGGLAQGWSQAKKQLMDEERAQTQKQLQRNLDDAHSVAQGLLENGVDLSSMPELEQAYQNYITGFTGKGANLQQAQALSLLAAQHQQEIQRQIEAKAGRGAEEGAYRGARGRERAGEEFATISPEQARTGNFMMNRGEAAQFGQDERRFKQQKELQGAGFGQQRSLWEAQDQRGAAIQYQRDLQQTRIHRADALSQAIAKHDNSQMGQFTPLTEQQVQALRVRIEQDYPDPEPPPGLAGNKMVSPPRQAQPAGAKGETKITQDGKHWRKVPGGWQEIQ